MAHYTITIKTLIDNDFDFKMTTYPIFDEEYRDVLNQKILNHYYNDEIGFETAPLFRFYLNTKLNEIMPFYNTLYATQKAILDSNTLLNNVNIHEEFGRNTTGQNASTSTSNSKNVFNDTPQGKILSQSIEDQDYATNLSQNQSSIIDNSSLNGTENYIKNVTGNNGSKYNIDILNDIKNNLLNIDMLIINDLRELFMGIY